MKKLFLIAGCLLVLSSSSVLAQGDKPAVIVVQSDVVGSRLDFYVAHGGDKAERQSFKVPTFDSQGYPAVKYQQLIASYLEQGYVLQSMTASNVPGPGHTFIFVKVPKP